MNKQTAALDLLRSRSNADLLAIWEDTEHQVTTQETYVIRRWVMEIMQERDPDGFDAWMDNEDYTNDGPEHFLFKQ